MPLLRFDLGAPSVLVATALAACVVAASCAQGSSPAEEKREVRDDDVCEPTMETCDQLDNDCDGDVDEGCACTAGATQPCWSGEPSTKNEGACKAGTQSCSNGAWGACAGQVLPSPEICNGLDDDCNGSVDDGFDAVTCGAGICQATIEKSCVNGVEQPCEPGPPAAEVCDGLDNNCDGLVDEGCACKKGDEKPCYPGNPQDLKPGAACKQGTQSCNSAGQWGACEGAVTPITEKCDGLDNDCDGQTDEGNPGGGVNCNTGQLGVCGVGKLACEGGMLACKAQTSGTSETCDGKDNDCDGQIDEGNPGGGASCTTTLAGACSAGQKTCKNGALACVSIKEPEPEICDGIDNDCDQAVDEGNPGGGDPCTTGLPGVCQKGTALCQGGKLACVENVKATAEICGNGLDDDCDGVVDDGCACEHDKCTTGGKLAATCHPCVAKICAVDPFCCNNTWDSLCVTKVRTVCKSLACAEAQGSCSHVLCQTGGLSQPLTSGCDATKAGCVSQVCAVDPYCCKTDWDALCVTELGTVCNHNCD
jgi:hypothetical protein